MSDDMLERFTEAVLGAIDYDSKLLQASSPEAIGQLAARVAKGACEEIIRLKIEELKEDHQTGQWSPFKRPGQSRPPEAQPLTQERGERLTLGVKAAQESTDVPSNCCEATVTGPG